MSKNRIYSQLAYPGDKSFYFELFQFNTKRKKEAIVLILLASIGIFGFLYVFNCMHSNSGQSYQIIQANVVQAASPHLFTKSDQFAVDVQGNLVKEMSLSFQVTNFDQSYNYFIDFGDGAQKQLTGSTTEYSYSNSGTYTISLAAVKDNKTAYATKKLQIK